MYTIYKKMMNDKRNYYEVERDQFIPFAAEFIKQISCYQLGVGIADLILGFISPYVVRADPYTPDRERTYDLSRKMVGASSNSLSIFAGVPLSCIDSITNFMLPDVVMTEPIPCAITTIGRIFNFNYSQQELYDNAQATGNISVIGNQSGFIVAEGSIDPRNPPAKNKHGRPSKKTKCHLFGTSQTTFWVKTPLRPGKTFCVKVFQTNVSFETLGGLFVDCRDIKDVNNTVLEEMKRALNRPELVIEGFHATMRNYKCKLNGDYHICVGNVPGVIDDINTGNPSIDVTVNVSPSITCSVDYNRYPSAIVEIKVANHTSKKGILILKIFQGSKINIDSCTIPEHLNEGYRFLNELFIKYKSRLVYSPQTAADEYDSDYYYKQAGVASPPECLVNY
jgi:hypothetical protein